MLTTNTCICNIFYLNILKQHLFRIGWYNSTVEWNFSEQLRVFKLYFTETRNR